VRSGDGLRPLDLVDLLLDLETLEVIKLWLVALELGEELVFTRRVVTLQIGVRQVLKE
jgi:hypothetical protein